MKNKHWVLMILLMVFQLGNTKAQAIDPDDTSKAFEALVKARGAILTDNKVTKPEAIREMLRLGMVSEAKAAIDKLEAKTADKQLVSAEYLIFNNDFEGAGELINVLLKQWPNHEDALLLKGFLEIQAWRLSEAADIAAKIGVYNRESEKAELLLGRVRLLQKKYPEAMAIAKKVQQKNKNSAGAYLLEADVYFWDQHPELAEKPLIRSLSLDPFNADARFSYGYAIWRRIDATQLNAMAAQWELALAINPLHYQTHWHWGNGHTNLTYADYAEKDDEAIRKVLTGADELVKKGDIQGAIAFTRTVGTQYPGSVLPLMHRASIYYSAFDVDRKLRLDSAEAIFKSILSKKKHYGPAHNGLSAVIKSKRIPYLQVFDSITNVLKHTTITDPENFNKVFPDVAYYQGETAKAMVWNQLYTSVAYFPFLSRQNNSFRIPPLHQDLAITMNSPSFRYMTTFDNRQWMDIRGVGSGAAAIEYAERGAFLERNVVLHEYAHLFHGTVLTDAESRKIRSLYYNAMKEKRTLDYYSQNNESEYFAQTYPAYFEGVKVHPLDFKSMNTTADLKTKDPAMYQFLDQLVKKEKAYLAGDKKAMASNWAEVYVNLSNKNGNSPIAVRYLDTALTYDAQYLPAYLAMSRYKQFNKDFEAAETWLAKAKEVDPKYAPVYAAYAALAASRLAAGDLDEKKAIAIQTAYLQQSIELEDDYQELARLNLLLRELYRKNALFAEAIKVADQYVRTGATVSTYLRDRRDEAIAFSAVLKTSMGNKESVAVLKNLVDQKPQNFEFRNMYADALSANGDYPGAIATLQQAQRILKASGNARSDYYLRIAEYYDALNEKDSLLTYLSPFLKDKSLVRGADQFRYINLLIKTGNKDKAAELFSALNANGDNLYKAAYFYTQGKLMAADGRSAESAAFYEKAIQANPYYAQAYKDLIAYARDAKLGNKVKEMQGRMKNMDLK